MSTDDEGNLDPSVVERLFEEHGPELLRFLGGVLRDSQLAHDVAQSALAKLIERGHTVRRESRKAWLFQVAFNEALAVRRRQATGQKVLRRAAWSQERCTPSAEEPLLRAELVNQVRTALQELPADQQQVVRMRIYEEKTFACIAKELNIPLGTALGRMRSALAKLKRTLDTETLPKIDKTSD